MTEKLLAPQSSGDMPRECVPLHAAHTSRPSKRREVAIHAQNVFQNSIMGGRRSLCVDQVHCQSEDAVTISGTFASEEIATRKSRAELGDMWRVVEPM